MPKKKKRGKKSFTIPITIVAPVATIPLVPCKDGWAPPYVDAMNGKWTAVAAHVNNGFNAFVDMEPDGRARFGLHIPRYLAMIVGGVFTHKLASFFGVNRALGQAGIPIFRV